MTSCECDDDFPEHEHRAGDIWIPVDWKAVAREFVISGERPNYLARLIHVLAEAMEDEGPRERNAKISASMKQHWKERRARELS